MPDASYHILRPGRRWATYPGEQGVQVNDGWPAGLEEVLRDPNIRWCVFIDCGQDALERLARYADHVIRLDISYGHNKVRDFSVLSSFPRLERLSVRKIPSLKLICFTALPQLRYLECEPRSLDGLESATSLTELSVTYRMEDLRILAPLTRLEVLTLNSTTLQSVAGIESLPHLNDVYLVDGRLVSLDGVDAAARLEILHLQEMKHLTSISAVARVNRLRVLRIDACKRIADLSAIGVLVQLKKLWLENLGDVPSIAFLEPLKALRYYVAQGTRVADGDLSVLLQLPALELASFPNSKHYSAEVLEALADKRIPLWARPGFAELTHREVFKG